MERIADLVNEGRITGISEIRDESDLNEPVRLVIDIKKSDDPDIVLNQLYEFSPLQESISIIFLALVDGKPRELTFKELLQEFLRHRVTVIRRRTQFLLSKARKRKHTVEGLLLALANIDEICAVPGVDVLLVGPSDFSIEMDVPLDYPSKTYQDALDKVVAGATRHGVAPGMLEAGSDGDLFSKIPAERDGFEAGIKGVELGKFCPGGVA